MCGIFGILQHGAESAPSRAQLAETIKLMQHRGPDGNGMYSAAGIGMAHTRLSLVDLNERSNQPFWDRAGRYCLVYNGELYDYQSLRYRLMQQGVTFRTSSDTEVLLAALLHFGVDETLPQLEGMFAFGLYDASERTLLVVRDRLGIKPLFICNGGDSFMFASSVKALEPWLTLQPDLLTISSYLNGFGGPTAGRSFYEHIEIVPPGAVIRIRNGGKAVCSQFFTLRDLSDPQQAESLARQKPSELVDCAEELLLQSVKSQLCADATVGALCSGGVDSSLVMAMAARFHDNLTVFHADVVGPLSECAAAERLARHLKLDFQRVAIRDQDFIDTMPDVVEHFGFPFTFLSNAVPFLRVAQLVRSQGVKAVLCGEGSDECYLGYSWLVPNVRTVIRRLPKLALRKLSDFVLRTERRLRGKGPLLGISLEDRQLVQGLQTQFENEIGPAGYRESLAAPSGEAGDKSSLTDAGDLSYILRILLHRNDSLGMAVQH